MDNPHQLKLVLKLLAHFILIYNYNLTYLDKAIPAESITYNLLTTSQIYLQIVIQILFITLEALYMCHLEECARILGTLP